MKKVYFKARIGLCIDELPSRLISILSRNEINAIDIVSKDGKCYLTIFKKDEKKFEKVAFEYGFSFIIINEIGISLLFEKYISRVGLTFGIVVSLVLFCLSDLFTVKTNFNEKDKAFVSEVVEKYVSSYPCIIKDQTLNQIKTELESKETVVGANVYKDGMALYIEIEYALDEGVIYYEEGGKDLSSSFDAVVTRIITLSGTKVVEKEQSVKKGDVLIKSGTEVNGIFIDTPAVGEVYGRVFYYDVSYFYKEMVYDVYTGRKTVYTVVDPFYLLKEKVVDVKSVSSYENFSVEYSQSILNCILPLKIKRYIIKETKSVESALDIKNHLDALVTLGKQRCLDSIDGEYVLLNVRTKLKEENLHYVVETYAEVERRIDTR